MRKNKIIILILLLFILMICLFQIGNSGMNEIQDDYIFFKLWGIQQSGTDTNVKESSIISQEKLFSDEGIMNTKKYYFQVWHENKQLKNISLWETIDANTVMNETIAPGTKGKFDIVITANQTSSYQIEFNSKTQKPQNLVFYLDETKKYDKLSDLQSKLKGYVSNESAKIITIFWEWQYNGNLQKNEQDTKDGMLLEKFCFDIVVEGQMIG